MYGWESSEKNDRCHDNNFAVDWSQVKDAHDVLDYDDYFQKDSDGNYGLLDWSLVCANHETDDCTEYPFNPTKDCTEKIMTGASSSFAWTWKDRNFFAATVGWNAIDRPESSYAKARIEADWERKTVIWEYWNSGDKFKFHSFYNTPFAHDIEVYTIGEELFMLVASSGWSVEQYLSKFNPLEMSMGHDKPHGLFLPAMFDGFVTRSPPEGWAGQCCENFVDWEHIATPDGRQYLASSSFYGTAQYKYGR
jgi:hypothetical protein